MKFLQTVVALSLMGWYLMLPPQTRTWWVGQSRYDDAAPLTSWTIERSFDRAEGCAAIQPQTGDASIGTGHAVCVATDILVSRHTKAFRPQFARLATPRAGRHRA